MPPEEYPVKLGAMLFTLVDPHRGREVAYNRWYERDHFYGGVMLGPGTLAGRRWVATRELKELRFPEDSTVAVPVDAGSYLATYFIERSCIAGHFAWANREVFELYEAGRGFDERTHAHTALYTFTRAFYRDEDPVPVELALDHPYAGLVSVHLDRGDGVSPADLDDWFGAEAAGSLLGAGGSLACMASWRPVIPEKSGAEQAPMDLGSGPGSRDRSLQLFFCDAAPDEVWEQIRGYSEQLSSAGLGQVRLAAAFIPTIPGTDTYADRLW